MACCYVCSTGLMMRATVRTRPPATLSFEAMQSGQKGAVLDLGSILRSRPPSLSDSVAMLGTPL